MIYAEKFGGGNTHSTGPTQSTPTLGISVSVDYWVLNRGGRLADPARVSRLPGADRTDSPYSIGIETPMCESCDELRATLIGGIRTALTAANDQDCRLLAVGVRPDHLDGGQQDGPPPETASARVRFATDPETAHSVYNVLLALDPAFVLLASTGRPTSSRRAALMDRSNPGLQRYRATHPVSGDDVGLAHPATGGTGGPLSSTEGVETSDYWRPVELVDESTVEWRSLDAATPTLLVDLIGDVLTVLQQARECRIEIASFGNGFEVGCLRLPTTAWRQQYLDDALSEGLESLRLRAYLDRLGFDTGWYRHAQPPGVVPATDSDSDSDADSDLDYRARCQQRAELLAADA